MSRYDLTDFEWRMIAPHLPNKPRGVARVDDRRVLGCCVQGHLGGICRSVTGRERPATIGSCDGAKQAFGTV
jgi:transposase